MIVGILLVPIAIGAWFWFGKVPVAVADAPFYHEREIVSVPLRARINRELEEIAEHEAGPASTEAAYLAAMWRIDWERERALD